MERLRRFLCNGLGWHRVTFIEAFDGISYVSRCERCGKRVLMDSYGQWFRANGRR